MSFLYNLCVYYLWGEVGKDDNSQIEKINISSRELLDKIALITKNKSPPQIIEGYGKKIDKKIEVILIKKKNDQDNEVITTDFSPGRYKQWEKISIDDKEQNKKFLEELKENRSKLKKIINERNFTDVWKNMVQNEEKEWKFNKTLSINDRRNVTIVRK